MRDMDDIFKDRLGDLEASVPDDMWSRIQSAQDSKDVKFSFWRRNRRLILAALFVLFSSGTGFWVYHTQSTTNVNEQEGTADASVLIASNTDDEYRSLLVASKEDVNLTKDAAKESQSVEIIEEIIASTKNPTETMVVLHNGAFAQKQGKSVENTKFTEVIESRAVQVKSEEIKVDRQVVRENLIVVPNLKKK